MFLFLCPFCTFLIFFVLTIFHVLFSFFDSVRFCYFLIAYECFCTLFFIRYIYISFHFSNFEFVFFAYFYLCIFCAVHHFYAFHTFLLSIYIFFKYKVKMGCKNLRLLIFSLESYAFLTVSLFLGSVLVVWRSFS